MVQYLVLALQPTLAGENGRQKPECQCNRHEQRHLGNVPSLGLGGVGQNRCLRLYCHI
jgi:hypothetical protein